MAQRFAGSISLSLATALWLAMAPGLARGEGPSPQSPPAAVLFRGATLVDAAGAEQRGMAILTRGEIIEKVQSVGAPAPKDARVVDVSGLFVAAGLINSHEHLATPPDRRWAEAMMRRDLYGGVTAVRDMADDLRQVADLARAARIGEIPGPDIDYAALVAGPEFFADPRTQAAAAGAVAGAVPWMQAITSATDLPMAIAWARGTGARAIKIYADLAGPTVAAIVGEAHRQGALAWAHAAVFPASPAEVIDAGVDSVSHVCMLAYQASAVMPTAYHHRAPVDAAKFAHGDNPIVGDLFRRMRVRGTVLDATLWVYREMEQDHVAHPSGPSPYCSLALAERLANQAWRAGVTISAGTDGFSGREDPWPPLQDELLLLRDAGLSPAAVLRAATVGGALALGRPGEMGTIAPGKLANLVFLAHDPLADVGAYKSVVLTVKRGALFWRKDYRPVTVEEMPNPE